MTIYVSDTTQQKNATIFPRKIVVQTIDDLRNAVSCDYVCAEYRNGHRAKVDFLHADCVGMDCDNDHSDNPSDWVNVEDLCKAFPDVEMYIHYSRNHMRSKGTKAPRPKFHVLFPILDCADADSYATIKRSAHKLFPFFDRNALDVARMFFGTTDPQVDHVKGSVYLDVMLTQCDYLDQEIVDNCKGTTGISEGKRNIQLSHFAGQILIRYGDTDFAYQSYIAHSAKCNPPLSPKELADIWTSAKKFYDRVSAQDSYVQPDVYNQMQQQTQRSAIPNSQGQLMYEPTDYTDVGQAAVFNRIFCNCLCYVKGLGYLSYNNVHWVVSDLRAQGLAQQLTDLQLEEANLALSIANSAMDSTGANTLLEQFSMRMAVRAMSDGQKTAYKAQKAAMEYKRYVQGRRSSSAIGACLFQARSKCEVDIALLDSDPYALCTPNGTYDLRYGMDQCRPNIPGDYITKVTACSPGNEGEKLWLDHLDKVFLGRQDLIAYVQMVCGTAIFGQVSIEALIIANGCGRNGKSTFWNTIARVMGQYSGKISAEVLTTTCKHNPRPELAELQGKRIVIAAEMREGAILDDGFVKKLASTDELVTEKKFKDPTVFLPSHTVVLYTNHLPKVRATDDGTWRRIWVIPFDAKFEGKSDIKNYTEYLYHNAGAYILRWVIEGARKAYDQGFAFERPPCVQEAVDAYRGANDWLANFIGACCELGEEYRAPSDVFYTAYCEYCKSSNEYVRNRQNFNAGLQSAGYVKKSTSGRKYFQGIRLRQ